MDLPRLTPAQYLALGMVIRGTGRVEDLNRNWKRLGLSRCHTSVYRLMHRLELSWCVMRSPRSVGRGESRGKVGAYRATNLGKLYWKDAWKFYRSLPPPESRLEMAGAELGGMPELTSIQLVVLALLCGRPRRTGEVRRWLKRLGFPRRATHVYRMLDRLQRAGHVEKGPARVRRRGCGFLEHRYRITELGLSAWAALWHFHAGVRPSQRIEHAPAAGEATEYAYDERTRRLFRQRDAAKTAASLMQLLRRRSRRGRR